MREATTEKGSAMTEERFKIRVEEKEWQGQPRFDIRLWVYAEDLDKMIPTRRGLSLRPDQLVKIRKELQSYEEAMPIAA